MTLTAEDSAKEQKWPGVWWLVMVPFGKPFSIRMALSVILMIVALACAPRAEAALGDEVVNVASVQMGMNGQNPVTLSTNEAVFMVEAVRTPSTIDFFRIAPSAPEAVLTQINGSDYSPSGEGEDFEVLPIPDSVFGLDIDFSLPVALAPAESYLAGELMIIRVVDLGQNGESDVVETVEITIATDADDTATLRLYESGPNTGEFFGYILSSPLASAPNDPVLTTPERANLTATYIDRFDETEVSIDTALIDPFGRLFDSITGDLVDGAVVTIVDAVTGEPADVFGLDGVSSYPSTLVTGGSVTDEGGFTYDLAPGEFLFPLMRPGDYRLLIEPPEDYQFPSVLLAEDFENLDNAPFEIIEGSYGGVFTVDTSGPLNFDVPLDAIRELVVLKTTDQTTAAIGDFVRYQIAVENRGELSARAVIQDTLPVAFRYRHGTARQDGHGLSDPDILSDGRTLRFELGLIGPGETETFTYVAAVGAGAREGEAVNRAVAINSGGREVSNVAEAAIQIQEDLLRSRLTIVGRVAEQACDGDADWARELSDGVGVAGVRLYMEDGRYVVTDENGLFHFEGVERGTHVVQMDTATLPAGYEAMTCEDNSRYAGSATSKFVDASGGVIWRANFYLKQASVVENEVEADFFDESIEDQSYDADWLNEQTAAPAWAYPNPDRTPNIPSINLGIKHAAGHRVSLSLNGALVSPLNFDGREQARSGLVEISRWRGVDLLSGRNSFEASITDGDGNEVETLREEIWFVVDADRARLVDDQSILVADGRTQPTVALRIEDAAGRAVHGGRVVNVDVAAPYRLASEAAMEGENAVAGVPAAAAATFVDPDGIARVQLEPTLQSGRVRLLVALDDGRLEELDVYLQPEKRDWVVVGVGTANAGFEPNQDIPDSSLSPVASNRLALFAKGMVKGDWLMTLAVDTAKRRGANDDELFDRIDPNAYYTLYGDRSYQFSEAESRYPLFVKLEKRAVQLLFGDYDTDLTDTKLGRYNRRLSGLRGVVETDHTSVSGFIAETNQQFMKDEFAADGTSGPFFLSGAPVVRNGEVIYVETRDRLRSDVIVSARTLTRYVDYEIDYQSGELFFRQPVAATDGAFNTNVIVVDYETVGQGDRDITLGGRAAVRPMGNERLEAGVTYLREEDGDTDGNSVSDLVVVDVSSRVNDTTEIRAEIATTTLETGDEASGATGDAYLLEANHQSERVRANAYLREEGAGFGLGQQASNTSGLRRYGAEADVLISEESAKDGEAGTRRSVQTEAYAEERLETGDERTVVSAAFAQDFAHLSTSLGVARAEERFAGGAGRSSVLATGSAEKVWPELGLTASVRHEEPIFSEDDEVSTFPQRTLFGVDKAFGDRVVANLRHEIINGADSSGDSTTAGLTMLPWQGGEVRLGADAITQDAGRRLAATVGVNQTVQLSDKWSTTFGVSHRARVDGGDEPRDLAEDAAVSVFENGSRSPLVQSDDFTSVVAGAGYRSEVTAASARVEARLAETNDRYVFALGAAREVSEELSFAGAGDVRYETQADADDRRIAEARLGVSWRPRGEGPIVLNRLDLIHDDSFEGGATWKAVNNLGVNTMLSRRTQAAIFHGIKYTEFDFDGVKANGVTNLLGGEIRHDITKTIDVGLSASILATSATKTSEVAWGPSLGISPAKNVWMSVGYNFEGFNDEDFEAAETSRDGIYAKLRVKFDQDTLDGFLRHISPSGR